MNSISGALRGTLDNLDKKDFKRLKHLLMDQGIPIVKLEKADQDDIVNVIIEYFTKRNAGQAVVKILTEMNLNERAKKLMDLINLCQVGLYGDVKLIYPTGASETTACQDGDDKICGVAASQQLAETDLERMKSYKGIIKNVGRETGMDPAVIAAVISRSSRAGSENAGLEDGWSKNQDCFGLMQIAKQWHSLGDVWNDEDHIRKGTKILIDSIKAIQSKFPKWTKEEQLKGGLAAYAAGPDSVRNESVDENTPGKDYANDVIARAQFYRDHLFNL